MYVTDSITLKKHNFKPKNKKNYYYHLTTNMLWGDSIFLSPKNSGDNRGFDEPHYPRTCVAKTIINCLSALDFYGSQYINVYRTKNKVLAYDAIGVPDVKITNEKWIFKKVEFVKIGTIKHTLFEEILEMQMKNDFTFGESKNTIEYRRQKEYKNNLVKRFKNDPVKIKYKKRMAIIER